MRFFGFAIVILLLCAGSAARAQTGGDRPLIDADFAVPDLSDWVALLEARFQALREHLEAMEGRLAREGVDQRLAELFLPEKPEAFRGRYRLALKIAAGAGDLADWQQLAADYLERGALDDASTAAFRVWRESAVEPQRAAALTVMAEAALARGETGAAVNLYRKSIALHSTPTALVLDVGGVGYRVQVPMSTYYEIERSDSEELGLYVYTHVREDAIELYGFWTEREQHIFEKLIARR